MNPRRFSPKILQEVEIGAALVIDGDKFANRDRSFRQAGQRVHDVGKLSVQRFSSSREKTDASSRLDGERPISIKFDLFCGVRRYVVLEMRGPLERSMDPPSMPHNSHQGFAGTVSLRLRKPMPEESEE